MLALARIFNYRQVVSLVVACESFSVISAKGHNERYHKKKWISFT